MKIAGRLDTYCVLSIWTVHLGSSAVFVVLQENVLTSSHGLLLTTVQCGDVTGAADGTFGHSVHVGGKDIQNILRYQTNKSMNTTTSSKYTTYL